MPASDLRVSLTFYSRLGDTSQFEQAVGAVPQKTVLGRVTDVPVTGSGSGRAATTCITVLPDSSATAPASGTGACAPGSPSLVLDCTPDAGVCGDVYPVSVALLRQGDATTVARFTTFLTYQEPQGPVGSDGALRVGLIAPVLGTGATAMAGALATHRDVPVTLAVSPRTAVALGAGRTRAGPRARAADRPHRRRGAQRALRPRQPGGAQRSGHRRRDPGPAGAGHPAAPPGRAAPRERSVGRHRVVLLAG